MNRDTDDRVGSRDVEAAKLFAAARAFRPSPRARRRTLRALGLPVGLSLVGSSLAHAAHVLTASLKGWGMVAGLLGAAGGVAYVASAPPSGSRSVASASHLGERRGPAKQVAARSWATASVPLPEPVEAPAEGGRAASAAPLVAVGGDQPPAVEDVSSLPKPARRSSFPLRPRSRALPSDSPSTGGSPPPPVSPVDGPAERPVSVVAPTEPPRLDPELSAHASGGPAFRPRAAVPAPAPPLYVSPTPPSPASPLRGELAMVAEAQRLLRTGDGAAARAVLDRHARVYPGGALGEEVEVLRLRALLADGDARGAREAGESFLQRHPASPLGARVRSLLEDLGRSRRAASIPLPPATHGESL